MPMVGVGLLTARIVVCSNIMQAYMDRLYQRENICTLSLTGGRKLATFPRQSPTANNSILLEQLYRTYWRDLARYIAKRFGAGPPEPEEIAQATFTRLAASGNVSEIRDPMGYLCTIACNLVIDHKRRQYHSDVAHRDLSAEATFASEVSPERILLGKERLVLFEQTLAGMPAMRRRIFLLVRVEGMSIRDVAQQFALSEDAVYKHVQRALHDCATALAKAEKQG